MPDNTLSALIEQVLARARVAPEGQAELRRFDHVFQFMVTDRPAFHVAIRSGEVTVVQGEAQALPFEEMETVRTDAATLRALFEGRARLVDLGWEGRLQMPLYGPKMHITAWLNRLIKLAHGIAVKPQG